MQPMEEIYQQYARTVYKFLLSRTQNPDLAEELTQETFYQAIRTVDRYDGSSKVSTWLCGIAKNVLFTWRRKNHVAEDIEEQVLSVPSAEEESLKNLRRMELMKQLHNLEEPYRETVYLRLFGNLSFREIGEVMGKNENWARVTFYRGKEKLKNREMMK